MRDCYRSLSRLATCAALATACGNEKEPTETTSNISEPVSCSTGFAAALKPSYLSLSGDERQHPRAKGPSDSTRGLLAPTQLRRALFDDSGQKIPDAQVDSDAVAWRLLSNLSAADLAFNGIGLYHGSGGGCTATLIETGGSASAPAYVLTNGHCVTNSLLPASGAIFDAAAVKSISFSYFQDSVDRLAISGKTIRYASMDNTDVAVVELDTTFGNLRKQGICPRRISATTPSEGDSVANIGVPQSGLASQQWGLRLSECQIGRTVALREGSYSFEASLRHQCSTVGGSSGSPLISTTTGEIVAVINTAVNDNAERQNPCSLNRPCEVSNDADITTQFDQNYAQPVAKIAHCFNDEGLFDTSLAACELSEP